MGFPFGNSDLCLPKLLVHVLTLLDFFRKFTSVALFCLGFYEPEMSFQTREESLQDLNPACAALIRELLPVVKFSEIIDPPESCAVCLYDFDGEDEIRRQTNCRHIFHRSCLDRWMDHDQKTCPLCRAPFIPEEMLESFNERLWLVSGHYGDIPLAASRL